MTAFVRPPDTVGTFVKGYRYRVRHERAVFGAVPNDTLVFVGGGEYSPYDDAWIYTFRRLAGEEAMSWFLRADDPLEKPRDDFEELGP